MILLDVDGVLNAVNDPQEGYKRGIANGWPIMWRPKVVTELNYIHAHGADIRWLTTWCHDANAFISPLLGLPHFPVLGYGHYCEYPREPEENSNFGWWWKAAAVRDLRAETDEPILWVDDDLKNDTIVHEWCKENNVDWIAPNWMLGISNSQLEKIKAAK